MYYVKIPLRHLCKPEELNAPEDERDALWAKRVEGLLRDLRTGLIPAWAVSVHDLNSLALLNDDYH